MWSTHKTLLAVALVAALVTTSFASNNCAKPQQLWKILIRRTYALHRQHVSAEVEWCVHEAVHPALIYFRKKGKRTCISVRSYKNRVRNAVRKCRRSHTPKKVPHFVVKFIAKWSARKHKRGVPEEAICCLHGHVHSLFKRRQFQSKKAAIHAVRHVLKKKYRSCIRYAHTIRY